MLTAQSNKSFDASGGSVFGIRMVNEEYVYQNQETTKAHLTLTTLDAYSFQLALAPESHGFSNSQARVVS